MDVGDVPSVCCAATSPASAGEERVAGFSLGFGVGRGLGFVFEHVVGTDEGE